MGQERDILIKIGLIKISCALSDSRGCLRKDLRFLGIEKNDSKFRVPQRAAL